MALGRPSITTPGKLELRTIQQGFDNTRERLVSVEAEVQGLLKASTTLKTAQSLDAVTRQISQITQQLNALAAKVGAPAISASTETTVIVEGGAGNDENTMQNTPFTLKPVTLGTSAANLLNPPTLTGGVGVTLAKTFILLKSLRVVNRTASPASVSVWLGLTAGSAAGTEVGWSATVVPANGFLELFFGGQGLRISTTDFLTGLSSVSSALSISGSGEIGIEA